MHRGRLSNLALAQPGKKKYEIPVCLSTPDYAEVHAIKAISLTVMSLIVPTGWAMCDGTKTDLHEA